MCSIYMWAIGRERAWVKGREFGVRGVQAERVSGREELVGKVDGGRVVERQCVIFFYCITIDESLTVLYL